MKEGKIYRGQKPYECMQNFNHQYGENLYFPMKSRKDSYSRESIWVYKKNAWLRKCIFVYKNWESFMQKRMYIVLFTLEYIANA